TQLQAYIPIDYCMHGSADRSVNLTAHHTIHFDTSMTGVFFRNIGYGEGSFIYDLSANQQNLRQDKHNKKNGNDGTAAQVLTDTGNGSRGSHQTDKGSGHCQNRAGGND